MSSTRTDRIGDALVLGFSIAVLVVVCLWIAGVNLTDWWRP